MSCSWLHLQFTVSPNVFSLKSVPGAGEFIILRAKNVKIRNSTCFKDFRISCSHWYEGNREIKKDCYLKIIEKDLRLNGCRKLLLPLDLLDKNEVDPLESDSLALCETFQDDCRTMPSLFSSRWFNFHLCGKFVFGGVTPDVSGKLQKTIPRMCFKTKNDIEGAFAKLFLATEFHQISGRVTKL